MSRSSRRFRRGLVLLNLMVAAYVLATVWVLRFVSDPAVGLPATRHIQAALPGALVATALALALVRWPPPRAPHRMLRLGLVLQLGTGTALLFGASRSIELLLASLYAILALRLASRTFLTGEPRAEV